jgi:UDP-glucose 4-epimerase
MVHASTSEVYGTPSSLPIREDHPLNAQSPYAATKVAADQLVLSYHRSFGVPVTILRPFNTFGPRQSARAVVTTILTQLLSGRTEIALGRLDTRRDLTFVTDTADGFVRAAVSPGIEGQTIQLGSGRAVSIGEVLNLAAAITGTESVVKVLHDPRRVRPGASEVEVLQSDPERARTLLGWQPRVTLEDGLQRTTDWLRQNLFRFRDYQLYI